MFVIPALNQVIGDFWEMRNYIREGRVNGALTAIKFLRILDSQSTSRYL